ncbi:hypothetical protein BDN70DRAFT_922682 [Pholiota conissans]|uniref:Uncharacterized protein n=1 Tax=Pholiota conissans TaxID=109636 RepID=A0A9P6CYI7_9AGAR|nr:hypothetical protein BDN70DRAFT_922682 [Pholiota conissans]
MAKPKRSATEVNNKARPSAVKPKAVETTKIRKVNAARRRKDRRQTNQTLRRSPRLAKSTVSEILEPQQTSVQQTQARQLQREPTPAPFYETIPDEYTGYPNPVQQLQREPTPDPFYETIPDNEYTECHCLFDQDGDSLISPTASEGEESDYEKRGKPILVLRGVDCLPPLQDTSSDWSDGYISDTPTITSSVEMSPVTYPRKLRDVREANDVTPEQIHRRQIKLARQGNQPIEDIIIIQYRPLTQRQPSSSMNMRSATTTPVDPRRRSVVPVAVLLWVEGSELLGQAVFRLIGGRAFCQYTEVSVKRLSSKHLSAQNRDLSRRLDIPQNMSCMRRRHHTKQSDELFMTKGQESPYIQTGSSFFILTYIAGKSKLFQLANATEAGGNNTVTKEKWLQSTGQEG